MTNATRAQLVDALTERGVTYLDGGDGSIGVLSDAELIGALAQSDDARLQWALIPLFLSRPVLASLIPALIANLSPREALHVKQRYTAAACLQRTWRARLSEFVPDMIPLPDWFSAELGLPALTEMYGQLALCRLTEQMAAQQDGVDCWVSCNKTFEDFIHQREVEQAVM